MKQRLARLGVLAAAAVLLAACSFTNLLYSNIAFAYSNAAPMLTWAVDDFVDLNDGQKDWVRERFLRVLAWHRNRELPEYRQVLTRFEASLDGGLTVEEVRAVHGEMRQHYHRLVEQLLPHMAELLLQLDAEQVAGLDGNLADDNRKVSKESGRNAEERRTRATRKTLDHLEAWTGTLDEAQRELVVSRLRSLPDLSAERMADRRYRQAAALALIRARPDRDTLIAGLRRLLIETDTWRSPEYLRRLQERDTRNFEMLSALSKSLTAKQLAQVHRRLGSFMTDIGTLTAAQAGKPAS